MDLGVFQDTKVADRIHTRTSVSYRVLTEDAQIFHRRRVAVLYQDVPHFKAEAFQPHRPNVMRF